MDVNYPKALEGVTERLEAAQKSINAAKAAGAEGHAWALGDEQNACTNK